MCQDSTGHRRLLVAGKGRWIPNTSSYPYRTMAYEEGEVSQLDVFLTPDTPPSGAPIHLFVHGGAWRAGSKEMYAFPAPAFVDRGAIYIVIGFPSIPKVRLPDMVRQVRRAIAWVYQNAASFGGDPERLYVSGHSSGGHLCAMALTTDWGRFELPDTIIKGGLVVSGMFDLEPVMLSARRSYLKLSAEETAELSPRVRIDRIACPLILACGDGESPEFKRQSRDMAAALTAAGKPCTLIEIRDADHFEIIEQLARVDSVLGRAAIEQMGLAV